MFISVRLSQRRIVFVLLLLFDRLRQDLHYILQAEGQASECSSRANEWREAKACTPHLNRSPQSYLVI